MRLFLILLAFITHLIGAPSPEVKIPKISGEIVYGLWIDAITIKQAAILADDTPDFKTMTSDPCLIVLIKKIEGVDEEVRQRLNGEFESYLLQSDFKSSLATDAIQMLKNDSNLLLLVIPCKEMPDGVKLHNQIAIKDILYQADDFGGKILKCDKITIEQAK